MLFRYLVLLKRQASLALHYTTAASWQNWLKSLFVVLLLDGLSALPVVGQARLYGMTYQGGNSDRGVLFSIDPTTNTYTQLKDFQGLDGANTYGSLTVFNNILYGMTNKGGSNVDDDFGVLFSFDPATNTYTKLRDFDYGDGANPWGSLTVFNNILYGMTEAGGSNGTGVLFSFNPATKTYTKLQDLTGDNGTYSTLGQFTVYNPLSLTLLPSSSIACVGSVVSLSAQVAGGEGAPSFNWQGPLGITLSQPTTSSVVSVTLGQSGLQSFTLAVTDGAYSTTATLSLLAVTNQPPVIYNLSASGGGCPYTINAQATGSSFIFTGPNGYVYSTVYRDGGTYNVLASGIKEPGTYPLTVYHTTVCGTSSVSRPVTVSGNRCP
jgi:uncharacterized repeat protein (TIGR03803 family)